MASNKYKSRNQIRLPFVPSQENRDYTASKDQRFINCYINISKTVVSDDKKLYLSKRPGLNNFSQTTSGVGRGCWYFGGSMYHATGSTLYKDNVALISLTPGITDPCGAVEILCPTEALFLADGFTAWIIFPDGTYQSAEQSFNRWAANTVYGLWDRVIPTTYAGQTVWYYVTTPGTSGATEPTWGATTVTSGTVTYTKMGTYTGAKQYTTRTYAVGDLVQPSTESGYFYKVTVAGTTTAEPSWSLIIGSTTTQNGVAFENMGYYGGFPSPHLPQPCYLDGYVFLVPKGSSDVQNSFTTYPWSWNPLDFISADSFSGDIVGFARYNNYLAAMGTNNMELFYDAANPTGSPLKRHDSFIMQTGTPSPYCILQSEMMLLWVGTSNMGGKTVWLLDGFDPKDVGTAFVNRILTAETNPDLIRGYGIRIDGHLFFVVNLPTANKTLVLDVGTTLWYEWQHNGGLMPFNFYTTKDQEVILQHTDGTLYKFNKTTYVDNINTNIYNINYIIITDKIDFDNRYRKFFHSIDVIGDLENSNLTLYWSDDDYQTWNAGYNLSMTTRPRVVQCGQSRRRAFKIVHSDNAPCRLEGLEFVLTQGTS